MPIRWQGPGGDQTINAGLLLLGAVVCFVWGVPRLHPYLIGLGVIFAICGSGLWFGQPWARWFTVFALLLFSGYSGVLLATKGFDWVRLGALICGIWTAWQTWSDFSPDKNAEQQEEEDERENEEEKRPLISLALLLREPRYLDSSILSQIVSAAWGETYGHGEDGHENESSRFVVGESPLFLIQSPRAMFM